MSLAEPTTGEVRAEIDLEKTIRNHVVELIRSQGWSEGDLAQKLGLLPAGVALLMKRDRWSLETAVRVATRLGLHLELNVQRDGQRSRE
jgi:hypothetical protein